MKNIIESAKPASVEQTRLTLSGWGILALQFGLMLGGGWLFIQIMRHWDSNHVDGWSIAVAILLEIGALFLMGGYFTLQPNEAKLLLLFGKYKGTVRDAGFHWVNPFYSSPFQAKISLRARTLNVEKLKVNDKRGNPIEIAAVVVWRVADTAQAAFDVDNYSTYVHTQSETSLRHLATSYSYDDGEEDEITLRSNVEVVSQALREELTQRLAKAGVAVDEARLTNLSYAPEIAQAMLRRQQAEAVIAARTKIVHGGVSMVAMALKSLAEQNVVHLDDERKAAMVSNLLVVLCGESEVHPVVNAGTLYS